ncbi:MAG: glycosyltransferase family 9 protein [Candidatus Acidiferrales bacterium]
MIKLRETDTFPTRVLRRPKRLLKWVYSSVVRKLFYDLPRRTGTAEVGRENVLVVRTDGLGDLILATPIFKHIKKAYGESRIYLLTRTEWADLFQNCPHVDDIIPLSLRAYGTDIFYRLRFLRSLREKSFGLAIHPVYSRESLSDEIFCSSHAAQKIGFDGDLSNIRKREKLVNDRYYSDLIRDSTTACSAIEYNRHFTEQLLRKSIDPGDFQPELWLTGADRAGAQRLLRENGLDPQRDVMVAIFPGASWTGREWAPSSYAELADRIVAQYGATIIICGAKTDLVAATSVASRMTARSINLAGRTNLCELAAVFKSCSLFIGNETGPLHMAVAVGTPTLGIMGGGHFGRFYPYGDLDKHRVAFKKMDCYGCNWQCIYETTRCIREISVDDVWRETVRLMEAVVLPTRERHDRNLRDGVALPR